MYPGTLLHMHIYLHTYAPGGKERKRERAHTKLVLQSEDHVFTEQIEIIKRQAELLGYHMAGSIAAKKRFEVMVE